MRVSLDIPSHQEDAMTIRHRQSIVAAPAYRVHRRVTWILSAIVVSLAMIVVAVANMVYFTETGASLIPGLGH